MATNEARVCGDSWFEKDGIGRKIVGFLGRMALLCGFEGVARVRGCDDLGLRNRGGKGLKLGLRHLI
jgi:hypothetical protein